MLRTACICSLSNVSEIRKLRNRKTKENTEGYILVNEMDGMEYVQKKLIKRT